MWSRFYGTKHLGAITGYNMSWMVAGTALGPYFFSLLYGFYGSYNLAAYLSISAAAILLFFSFSADNVNESNTF